MPITGRLTTAGTLHLVAYPDDVHKQDIYTTSGVVLEMDDDDLRLACGKFLGLRVAIWPADELADLRGTSAMEPTPENMQHLAARLVAAEDHLVREVRSNEAAALVRKGLEADLKRATDDMTYHMEVSHRWAGDLEAIMQRLGVSCVKVDDARQTILDKLGDTLTFSDVTHTVSST